MRSFEDVERKVQMRICGIIFACLALLCGDACNSQSFGPIRAAVDDSAVVRVASLSMTSPLSATGGFDGARAYEHVRQLVEIGPRPPGSEGIHRAQAYIIRLGYGNIFVNESTTVSGDDHLSFIRRGVPGCDIIDFDIQSTYWHTPQDTLDKVDPQSLAIVGHVFIETLPALEKKFR